MSNIGVSFFNLYLLYSSIYMNFRTISLMTFHCCGLTRCGNYTELLEQIHVLKYGRMFHDQSPLKVNL